MATVASNVVAWEYNKSGFIENWPNDSGDDFEKGAVVVIGVDLSGMNLNRIGIAGADIADGAVGPVILTGQVRLARRTEDAPVVGDVIYWNNVDKELTIFDISPHARAGIVTVGRTGPGITAQTDTECVDIGM